MGERKLTLGLDPLDVAATVPIEPVTTPRHLHSGSSDREGAVSDLDVESSSDPRTDETQFVSAPLRSLSSFPSLPVQDNLDPTMVTEDLQVKNHIEDDSPTQTDLVEPKEAVTNDSDIDIDINTDIDGSAPSASVALFSGLNGKPRADNIPVFEESVDERRAIAKLPADTARPVAVDPLDAPRDAKSFATPAAAPAPAPALTPAPAPAPALVPLDEALQLADPQSQTEPESPVQETMEPTSPIQHHVKRTIENMDKSRAVKVAGSPLQLQPLTAAESNKQPGWCNTRPSIALRGFDLT